MTNEEIQQIALANGFKLKEQPDGTMALNPYVFDFARTLISEASWRELAVKGRAGFAAAPTPPAPEVEPAAWVERHGNWCTINFCTPALSESLPRGTKLYTHPANDGLRKAAEEVLKFLSEPEKMNKLGDYITGMCIARDNLRAELNKDKSC